MSGTADQVVVVVATITPAQGREADVEKALREAIPQVHAEPGCLLYSLHRSPSGAFVFVEKWSSAEALKVHSGAAALAALSPKLEGALAGPMDVQVLTPLPEGDAQRGVV
ncbi:putative quinol monooxygenase [Pseudonocardia acidicola]|uniref:Antibiotic biosynthesis monooxygenase n=1 Tax=Pseudonocardia acidicola TaxID=2724939 RepID=A0ABX1SLR4_9PSEU|nr:putative quinol monooxygenase [Pseudonocardia acidicola]NMI01778.1 antibiotic biosynthesis monooxygenase [Pseudonocardia acidicola]